LKNAYRIRSFPGGHPTLESPDGPAARDALTALHVLLLGRELEEIAGQDLTRVGREIRTEVVPRMNVSDIPADTRVVNVPHRRQRVTGSAQIADRFFTLLAGRKREMFLAIALDAKNRVTHEFKIAEGTPTSCSVCPEDVFRPLFRVGASRAIFVHNHPSGDPEPSREDIEITTLLAFSGETLGIRILDHVIIGDWDHFSFADSGLLGRGRRP
jgi:DNA repair protein RadC